MLPILNRTTSRLSKRARVGLVAAAVAVLASPLLYVSRAPMVWAEDPAPAASPPATRGKLVEFLPPLSKSEEKILAELEMPTEISFSETPLQDAVDYFKSLHGIEIQLDQKALEEAAVGSDTPITRHLKGVTLRSALRLMLGALDLTFDVHDEVLQITTKDKAESLLYTRTYPVGDLVEQQDYDSLMKAIITTVFPQTWSEVGGPGEIVAVKGSKSLVVSQTRDIHDEVLQLLRSLRAARNTSARADQRIE